MHWASETFVVWVMTTRCDRKLYEWGFWERLLPHLDRIMSLSPSTGAIRSSQSFTDSSGWLSFGRMVWSEKNNRTWTTKYRKPEFEGRGCQFYDTEVWAPDWNVVSRENRAPDVLIKLDNSAVEPDSEQGLIVAVRKHLATEHEHVLSGALNHIKGAIPDVKVVSFERSWAEEVYDCGYSNGLSDATSVGLYKAYT